MNLQQAFELIKHAVEADIDEGELSEKDIKFMMEIIEDTLQNEVSETPR